MMGESWSWSQISEEAFPKASGKPHYEKDRRTCVLPVRLEPGKTYVLYLPMGEKVSVGIEPGAYSASWFDPRDGRSLGIGEARGPRWTSPDPPDAGDWVILLKRAE